MTIWILFLIGMNFGLVAAVVVLWIKMGRPQKDDPRLSKGLQLLQSKIAVLEDLSERSEGQVQQLVKILDGKIREIQSVLQKSDENMVQIEKSMQKSIEVAEIFEDRIPHEEIIERQNSKKYLQAAQLAHQGLSPQEIAQKIDLSIGEIDMISKLNKDELLIDPENVPQWAKGPVSPQSEIEPFSQLAPSTESTDKIKQEFQQACLSHEQEQKKIEEKYQAFPKIEPNQFRKQMQSFVENVLGTEKSGGAVSEKAEENGPSEPVMAQEVVKPAIEGGVEWLENQQDLATAPAVSEPAAVKSVAENEHEISIEKFESMAEESQNLKKRAFEYVESLEAADAQAANPEPSAAAPKIEQEKVDKLKAEISKEKKDKRVMSEMTAELLKKVAAKQAPKKPDKFIRAENTGEVKTVKFPRLDIGPE